MPSALPRRLGASSDGYAPSIKPPSPPDERRRPRKFERRRELLAFAGVLVISEVRIRVERDLDLRQDILEAVAVGDPVEQLLRDDAAAEISVHEPILVDRELETRALHVQRERHIEDRERYRELERW